MLNGGTGDDTIYANDGDELLGESGNDFLNSDVGNDSLQGGDGKDTFIGDDGNDMLDGGNNGRDLLRGGDNNYLIGGLGRDILFGNAGADRFAIASGAISDRDLIQDYQDGVDTFDLIGNLNFGSLTFRQNGNRALIIEADTNQILASVKNTNINEFDTSDFV